MDIRPEWPVVESIPFTSLAKLNFTVGKPEDIAFCGALEYYDKVYDRVTPKADRPLKRTNKVFKSVTTSDDPVIRYESHIHYTSGVLCTLRLFKSMTFSAGPATRHGMGIIVIGIFCGLHCALLVHGKPPKPAVLSGHIC